MTSQEPAQFSLRAHHRLNRQTGPAVADIFVVEVSSSSGFGEAGAARVGDLEDPPSKGLGVEGEDMFSGMLQKG